MTAAPLEALHAQARKAPKRILLSEGIDPRVREGGLRAHRDGLAQIAFVGPEADICPHLGGAEIPVHDPATSDRRAALIAAFLDARKHKSPTRDQAEAAISDPLLFAALMVRTGQADGTIGGAVATTADTVRAALLGIGRAEGVETVSSFFLMVLPATPDHPARPVIFSDCGMVVDPTAPQLAQIATASAASYTRLVGADPRIAMLSFSTGGSATHPAVTKVQEATALLKTLSPDLAVDGEMQFDAAIVPSVGTRKFPGSAVAGHANVFIFPNLDAGNIGYKIAQRVGGATAIGPVLQGLAHPANDLSRGCTASDVYDLIAVTVLQAG